MTNDERKKMQSHSVTQRLFLRDFDSPTGNVCASSLQSNQERRYFPSSASLQTAFDRRDAVAIEIAAAKVDTHDAQDYG